ncbi:recombinase family protein, partial [Acidovorax sp. NPDC077664]
MLVGYARVSTREQETRLQLDALRRAGVERFFEEKASAVGHRPVLRQCFDSLSRGDVLVFWKMDRIARSLRDLLGFAEELSEKGVSLRSLSEPIDTSTPVGEYLFHNLGAFAQLERSLIRERVFAGQVAAMRAGVRFGRPRLLQPDRHAVVQGMARAGLSKSEIGRRLGVSPATVRRSLLDADGHPRRL